MTDELLSQYLDDCYASNDNNNETNYVIQNSDFLHAKPFPVVESAPYVEPNEFEKNMLKHTLTAEQLLKRENEDDNIPKELSEEEKEEMVRRDYITKVKVIANDMLGKHPTANPTLFTKKEKSAMIDYMQYVIENFNDEDITKEFNEICNNKLFTDSVDYSTLPNYNYTNPYK